MNLAVLFFFFSLSGKTAAQNSILIIFFSQIASLCDTLLSGTLPIFSWQTAFGMMVTGVLGGYIGKKINRLISESDVNNLFIMLLFIISLVCVFNVIKNIM